MVTITLGDFIIDHKFVAVRNLTVDCLLGADFMKHHAAILDCDHNTLSLGGEPKVTIPLALKHQPVLCKASRAVHLVRSSQDLEIPSRSVQLIVGTTNSPSANATVMLVDTLPHQLHVARSLSSLMSVHLLLQFIKAWAWAR